MIRQVGSTLALAILVAGCSAKSAQQGRKPASSDVVASVGSTSITLAQVDEKALQMPAGNFGSVRLSQALYEARRAALDAIINDLVLDAEAKTQGIERTALVQREVTAKVPSPTDAEIAAWYQANASRLKGASLAQVRAPITAYLIQQRASALRDEYLDRLRNKSDIRVLLDPPRQVIATAGRPSQGSARAPVELVEFGDFQCPYCFSAHPTVERVLKTYGDRIHFAYRHYPLSIHPNARPAAEASQCADEQGKFWPYYDALFADQSKLGDADLKAAAARLGLDTARFNACVDSHKYKTLVDTDIKAGDDAGVSGTPAFFVNGRMLTGAQPFETFKSIIDEELARR